MRPRVMAVCGKGGVGKTSVSALIAGELQRMGRRALLVDADPCGGLTMSLALTPSATLTSLRAAVIDELEQGASRQDVWQAVKCRLLEVLTEHRSLALLPVGRPEDKGCFCAVNTLLKRAIEELSCEFDLTVIDAEAGVEQVNRDVIGSIDTLLLVSDPSVKSIRVAESIALVSRGLGHHPTTALLVNRVRGAPEARGVAERTGLSALGWIPEDETVRAFDFEARSFIDMPSCPARTAVAQVLQALLQQAGGS